MISDAKSFSRNDIILLAHVNKLAWENHANLSEQEFARIQEIVGRRFIMKDSATISSEEQLFLNEMLETLRPFEKGAAA